MNLQIGGVAVTIVDGVARWVSGMEVDVDGAPNAYAPDRSGLVALDFLGNAKNKAGKWVGVACDASGAPYVQGPDDPYPGFYVAQSAMGDAAFPERDPRHWVDASKVPYISIPRELSMAGVRKGDLALVSCGTFRSGAIVADVGPGGKIGEGSFALHIALGYNPQRALPTHHLVGIGHGVSFAVFLGTHNIPPWPRDVAEIVSRGDFY